MKNMFSGNTQKSIPKSLKECTKIDPVSNNLWVWATRLENLGKILFFILIFIGILFTLFEGVSTYELLEELDDRGYDRAELAEMGMDVSVFTVVVTSILKWGFFAFLEYCIYHVFALLVGALATLTQSSIITANVALLNNRKDWDISETEDTDAPDASKVSSAANTPKATVNSTPDVPRKIITRPTPPPPGMWECKNCGTHNKDAYSQCKKCAQYRSR